MTSLHSVSFIWLGQLLWLWHNDKLSKKQFEVRSFNVTWRPDLERYAVKTRTQHAKLMYKQLCKISRFSAPPFFAIHEKPPGEGGYPPPRPRRVLSTHFVATDLNLTGLFIPPKFHYSRRKSPKLSYGHPATKVRFDSVRCCTTPDHHLFLMEKWGCSICPLGCPKNTLFCRCKLIN